MSEDEVPRVYCHYEEAMKALQADDPKLAIAHALLSILRELESIHGDLMSMTVEGLPVWPLEDRENAEYWDKYFERVFDGN
jgi:hypothetical protein